MKRAEFNLKEVYVMSKIRIAKNVAVAGSSAACALLLALGVAVAGPGAAGHSHDQQHPAAHSGQHGSGEHGAHMDHDSMPGGKPGDPAKITRTILVQAKDTEFNLKSIQVRAGETVKFIIQNKGQLVHEFTIGDPAMQKMHQAEMQKMMDEGKLMADKVAPGVEHTHPNTALVGPGQKKEIVWEFAKDETLEFGCNIPGHAEAGMKGKFQFIN